MFSCPSVYNLGVICAASRYVTVFMRIILRLLPRGWLTVQPGYNAYSRTRNEPRNESTLNTANLSDKTAVWRTESNIHDHVDI